MANVYIIIIHMLIDGSKSVYTPFIRMGLGHLRLARSSTIVQCQSTIDEANGTWTQGNAENKHDML